MDAELPPLEPDPVHKGRRWALGALTLLGVAAAAVAILAANRLASDRAQPAAPPDAAAQVTVPTLPAPGEAITVPPVDEAAANVTIELFDGTKFDLYDHLATDGRPVLLNLWASWCPPCREEMPELQAASERYPGVLVLGVAVEDDPNAAEAFAEEIGVTYALAYDETDEITSAYPHFGLPATYVISPDRRVVSRYFGGVDEAQIDQLLAGAIG